MALWCVLAASALTAPPSPAAAAPLPELVLRARVLKIELNRLPRGTRHFIVRTRVLRVVRGAFSGRRFDFRIHSPARAGLAVGQLVFLRARPAGSGYLVDEGAIGPLRADPGARIYHLPGCKDYRCPGCTRSFDTVRAAAGAGFKGHAACTSGAAPAPVPSSQPTSAPATPAAPATPPGPPKQPWSRELVCKRHRDCVFAFHACKPCPVCAPSGPVWRWVTNRRTYQRQRAHRRRHPVRCAACRRCPPGEGSARLGTRPICVRGQCTVR